MMRADESERKKKYFYPRWEIFPILLNCYVWIIAVVSLLVSPLRSDRLVQCFSVFVDVVEIDA